MKSEPPTSSLCPRDDEWLLLIVDSHNSHFGMEFMQFRQGKMMQVEFEEMVKLERDD